MLIFFLPPLFKQPSLHKILILRRKKASDGLQQILIITRSQCERARLPPFASLCLALRHFLCLVCVRAPRSNGVDCG